VSELVDDLAETLATGDAVLMVGAGVSLAASHDAPFAGWRGLLEDGIARCVEVAGVPARWGEVQDAQLALGDRESWLAVAEQVTQRLGGRTAGEFRRWLRETVGSLQPQSDGRELIQALADLRVPVITTNYDGLIETVCGRSAITWRDGPSAQRILRGDDDSVLHVHGYWRDPESVILGVRSYEAVLANRPAQAMLRSLATMRSLILVGFGAGLEDPNFHALRRWMATTLAESEYRHFRLVLDSELASVIAAGDADERIFPVPYGSHHRALTPFLRSLAAKSSSSRRAGLAANYVSEPRLSISENMACALQAHVTTYDSQSWTARAIALNAVTTDGRTAPATELLRQLASDPDIPVVLLSGRFGSGKTWLLRWYARELATAFVRGAQQSPVPLYLRLTDAAAAPPRTFADLLRMVVPTALAAADLPAASPRVLLLDGLDELVGHDHDSLKHAQGVLSAIASVVPRDTRYVVCCRTEVMSAIDVAAELLSRLANPDRSDSTESAVMRALGVRRQDVATLELLDVAPGQADDYLSRSVASSIWVRVRDQAPYVDLTLTPVTVFLLEQALPRLASESEEPRLHDLYRAAVDSWFYRQGVNDPATRERLHARLEQLAASLVGAPIRAEDVDDILRAAGLLTRRADGGYEFRHFSFVDYFIARAVVRECQAYSSGLLGRLNLVAMYNVHRFAIPSLLDDHAWRSEAATPPMCDWVTGGMFASFMAETGWRENGFGMWPDLTALDGTLPFDEGLAERQRAHRNAADEGPNWGVTPKLAEPASAVSGVSWYDAAVYCRYVNARLPTADEAQSHAGCGTQGASGQWTASWYRERDGLIAVVERGSDGAPQRTIGMNPDLRSPNVGFRYHGG